MYWSICKGYFGKNQDVVHKRENLVKKVRGYLNGSYVHTWMLAPQTHSCAYFEWYSCRTQWAKWGDEPSKADWCRVLLMIALMVIISVVINPISHPDVEETSFQYISYTSKTHVCLWSPLPLNQDMLDSDTTGSTIWRCRACVVKEAQTIWSLQWCLMPFFWIMYISDTKVRHYQWHQMVMSYPTTAPLRSSCSALLWPSVCHANQHPLATANLMAPQTDWWLATGHWCLTA